MKIRVGVVGLGIMGEKLLKILNHHTETEVLAVCDSDIEKIRSVQSYLQLEFVTTDYKELVSRENIDLVYIAVPPAYHYSIVMDTIRAGKHVLCEKPLAASIDQAREMMLLAEDTKIVHAMNFPTYYREVYRRFHQMVSNGFLGTLRRIEMRTYFQKWPRSWQTVPWLEGKVQGGFLREVWPHFLHLIFSTWGNFEYISSYIEYPADQTKCETGVSAIMKLNNGVPILAAGSSQNGFAREEMVILTCIGTDGVLSIENWSELRACKIGADWETLVDANTYKSTVHLHDLISNAVSAIRGEKADLIDFRTGYEIQVLIDTIRENAKVLS